MCLAYQRFRSNISIEAAFGWPANCKLDESVRSPIRRHDTTGTSTGDD
jgi:hypothetical protein